MRPLIFKRDKLHPQRRTNYKRSLSSPSVNDEETKEDKNNTSLLYPPFKLHLTRVFTERRYATSLLVPIGEEEKTILIGFIKQNLTPDHFPLKGNKRLYS